MADLEKLVPDTAKTQAIGENISKAQKIALAKAEREREHKVYKETCEDFIDDLVKMTFKGSTLEQFRRRAQDAPSQALRIVALNLSDPKKAFETLQWLVERIAGKPKQMTETTISAGEGQEVLGMLRIVDTRAKEAKEDAEEQ